MEESSTPSLAPLKRTRFLCCVFLAGALFASPAARAADWWSIPDLQFFTEYGKLATGSQKERSKFAWMLFARVNQPAGIDSDGEQFRAWELWASNQETFTENPKWPDSGQRGKPEFTQAKSQLPTQEETEEVVRNQISFDYITQRQPPLYTVEGLQTVYSDQSVIEFPIGAIELKANWTRDKLTTSWKEPAPVQPGMVQLEANKKVYGFNGLHIMAKFAPTPKDPTRSEEPSWFWTTFEFAGNPGRDDAIRFITHPDALSPDEAKALLTEAGLKGKIAENYRCNGTQIHFIDPKSGEPVILGNTTMEGFAGRAEGQEKDKPTDKPPAQWTAWTTSCHTCHGQSRMNAGSAEDSPPRFDFIPKLGPVGKIKQSVVKSTWPLDFNWSVPDRAIPVPKKKSE